MFIRTDFKVIPYENNLDGWILLMIGIAIFGIILHIIYHFIKERYSETLRDISNFMIFFGIFFAILIVWIKSPINKINPDHASAAYQLEPIQIKEYRQGIDEDTLIYRYKGEDFQLSGEDMKIDRSHDTLNIEVYFTDRSDSRKHMSLKELGRDSEIKSIQTKGR